MWHLHHSNSYNCMCHFLWRSRLGRERERDRAVISSSSCSIVVVFQHRPWILMYNGYSTCLQRCIQTLWVLTALNVNNEVSIIFMETQEKVQKLLVLITVCENDFPLLRMCRPSKSVDNEDYFATCW